MAPRLRRSSRIAITKKTTAAAAAAPAYDENSMDVDADEDVQPGEFQVKLKTGDGKCFSLTKSQASCSNALRVMIESLRNPSNASSECIHLQSVGSELLVKVIEWCRAHCADNNGKSDDAEDTTAYSRRAKPETIVQLTDWDKQFFKSLDEVELFKLTHVSNYLDIRSLFNGCCQTIAKKWEGKRVEEIRKMYNINGDFSTEEENQMIFESKKLGMDN